MTLLSHATTAFCALVAGVLLARSDEAPASQEEFVASIIGDPRRLKQTHPRRDAATAATHVRPSSSDEGTVPNSLPAQVGPAVSSHAWAQGVAAIKRIACSQAGVTDKVTAGHAMGGHAYNLMYGMFLYPLHGETIKMLEIGLGCGMNYGPGASALLWRSLLPLAELWEAEVNGPCIDKHRASLHAMGIHPLVGSQRDPATLAKWMHTSGGRFDVIIDDGGHSNLDITTSFDHLWPHVAPGGLYFVEDLQVGRRIKPKHAPSEDTGGERVFSDLVQSWIEQKLIPYPPLRNNKYDSPDGTGATDLASWGDTPSNSHSIAMRKKHPLPAGLSFVFCQAEACVFGKEPSDAMRADAHVPCDAAVNHRRK